MLRPDWEKRICCARELAGHNPAAAQVLGFYAKIAAFQGQIFDAAVAEALRADPIGRWLSRWSRHW